MNGMLTPGSVFLLVFLLGVTAGTAILLLSKAFRGPREADRSPPASPGRRRYADTSRSHAEIFPGAPAGSGEFSTETRLRTERFPRLQVNRQPVRRQTRPRLPNLAENEGRQRKDHTAGSPLEKVLTGRSPLEQAVILKELIDSPLSLRSRDQR